jgi:hypothetical protein
MYDIIGTLYEDHTELPGWHVNSPRPVAGWESYQVEPSAPRRVFAGHPTFFYVFDNQEAFEALANQEPAE